ncbi:MAG: chemotaxis protein CheC [Chthonomonas sp.]|nr:chemotaxis protein CheC [Chthonomonas sp.]
MSSNIEKLGPVAFSAISEIANIGLGKAMTSLADLTGRTFHISIPNLDSVPVATLSEFVGGPEELCVATVMSIEGDVHGYASFVFDWASAQQLWKMVLGTEPAGYDQIDELHVSMMLEFGNILNSSFLNAISEMTDLRLHATPPQLGVEMAAALGYAMMCQAAEPEHLAITIEARLTDEDVEVSGFFIFFADIEGLTVILNRLGISEAA